MATSSYLQPFRWVLQMKERSSCEGNATLTLHLWRLPDGSHIVLFKWRQRMRGIRAKDNRFINVLFTCEPASLEHALHSTSDTASDLTKSSKQLCSEHWFCPWGRLRERLSNTSYVTGLTCWQERQTSSLARRPCRGQRVVVLADRLGMGPA
jgi:hypothetical protein